MSFIRKSILFVFCASSAATAQIPTDVLFQHVRPGTTFVVVVPDFRALTAGLNAFGANAGLGPIAEFSPQAALDELLDGNPAGLDPHGPLVCAMKIGPQSCMVIGTVADPDTWDARIGAPDGTGARTVFMRHQTWFARRTGRVIQLALDRGNLERFPIADGAFLKRFAPHGAAMLRDHQAVVWVEVAAWAPMVEPLLSIAEGFVQMGIAMSDPKAEGQPAMWRWMFGEARALIRESETYVAGFKLDAQGATGRDLLTVNPQGKVAAYLAQVQKSSQDPLRGLVGEPGMVVFGTEWRLPIGTPTFSEAALQSLLDTAQGRRLMEDPAFQEGIQSAMRLYRQVAGNSGNIDAAGEGITVSGYYLTDAPQAVIESLNRSMDTLTSPNLLGLMSSQMSMSVTRDAESIDGRSVDVYSLSIDSTNEDIRRAIHNTYGPNTRFYVAPYIHGAAYSMGSGDSARTALTRQFDPEAFPLSRRPRLVAARRTIAPDPQVCVFLDPAELARFGMRMWHTMGGPKPVPTSVESNGPLVAFGIYVDATELRSEMFVPAASIKRVLEVLNDQDL
jgi:hypothetical protein